MKYPTYATPRADLGEALWEFRREPSYGFVGLQVCPPLEVTRKAATMSVITRESILQNVDAKRGPKGNYNRIAVGGEDKSYTCEEYGLEGTLEDSNRALYKNDFDAEMATTMQVERALLLKQEERIKDLLWDPTTSWPSGTATLYTDNSGAPWDAAASDVIGQVLAACDLVHANCGMWPDTLLVGFAHRKNLLTNTGIKAQFPGADRMNVQIIEGALASILGVSRVIFAGAVSNTAKEGQNASVARLWGDDYAMAMVTCQPGAPLNVPATARSPIWVEDSAENVTAEQYREEQTRSDIFRVRHHVDELVCDPYLAHLMLVDA